MAPNAFLFVNKDSRSPSLSRNTGCEASLASKVNKHVQQQRFWKGSEPRKNWYRPFTRSDGSNRSTPSPPATGTCTDEDVMEHGRGLSCGSRDQKRPASPQRPSSSRRSSPALKPTSKSFPCKIVIKQELMPENTGKFTAFDSALTLACKPGHSDDPFNNTVVAVTPALREVLARHLRWAVSSSITEFAIQEGVRRIFSNVLTDQMHSAAFLAMATAQQRRTNSCTLPRDHSPEFYSYKATKLIREHIEANPDAIDPYTFVDIFRLAMCEWLNGNTSAARIHFSYIAQNWKDFQPRNGAEQHNLEVISTEDIFLAIDLDRRPLLNLHWKPDLPEGPRRRDSLHDSKPHMSKSPVNASAPCLVTLAGHRLMQVLCSASIALKSLTGRTISDLRNFDNFTQTDFASATTGPKWIIKRRIHATLYELQTLPYTPDVHITAVGDCIRRSLIIILFLASTTPARRVARTDFTSLATRLRNAMRSVQTQLRICMKPGKRTEHKNSLDMKEPALWLWMSIAGLCAAREGAENGSNNKEDIVDWFRKQSMMLLVRVCGPLATADELRQILIEYLYFEHVQAEAVRSIVLRPGQHDVAHGK